MAQHRLSWLVGHLAVEIVLAVVLVLAGAVVASQGPLWALVAAVPLVLAVRALWLSWWLGAAVVAELRWRAILARLLRQARHPRPR